MKTPLDDSMKALIEKKRKSIRKQASRLKAKRIAEQNFLRRKVSRKVRGIVKQFPDIGQTIEEFVKQNNVGADQWRRTGVLTFDGNVRDAKRVTYEKISQHLNSVVLRYSCVSHETRGDLPNTEGLPKSPPGGQEKASNSVLTQTFTGAVPCIVGLNIFK